MLRCAAACSTAAAPGPGRASRRASPPASAPAAPGRREALALAAAALVLPLAAPHAARADDDALVVVSGIKGERWNPVDATLTLPSGWTRRAGSRAKTSKTILYTDTYGPSYRYLTTLPRLLAADGDFGAESIQVQVEGRSGIESIGDLGPQSGIDPARAFELTGQVDDIVLSDVVSAAVRTDAGGQSYYEWELRTPSKHTVLLTAVATGGGLQVLSLDATGAQWAAHAQQLRQLQASFSLARSAETTMDASQRIYTTRKPGGFN